VDQAFQRQIRIVFDIQQQVLISPGVKNARSAQKQKNGR